MLEKINHYSINSPCSVYDEEALSALELAGRTAAKLNEAIEAFNTLETETNKHLNTQDADIAAKIKAQNEFIEIMNSTTMPSKVKSEVNNHIENGDFDNAINTYLGNLEERLNNLIGSVTEGSTTLDAEVIDGRVDYKGIDRGNLGEAIRTQISTLHDKITSFFTVVNQLYDKTTVEEGFMKNGTLIVNSNYYVSDFIPVSYMNTYTFKRNIRYFGANNSISGFDENKNYVDKFSVTKINETTGQIKITIPTVKYIRYDFTKADFKTAQFFEGDIFFEKLYEKGVYKILRRDVEAFADDLKFLINKNQTDFIISSENLLNPNTATKDFFIHQSGEAQATTGYAYSDYILVSSENVMYITQNQLITKNTLGAFYDANKTFIGAISGTLDESETFYTFTTPENCKYVRVNFIYSTNYMFTDKFYPSEFIPFNTRLSEEIGLNENQKQYIQNQLSEYSPHLFGKSISFNGDSICAGAGSSGGYGKIIAETYSMNYQNIAVSGGTIVPNLVSSSGGNRHPISETIQNMNENADFAILEGGVNDSALDVPLGAISAGYNTTLDTSTFYGAFENMLKQLISRFAGKKYGYIAVHQMIRNFRVTDTPETSFYYAAKKCCEKWGVPFLDLNTTVPPFAYFYSDNNVLYNLRTSYTKDGDGWHPNEEGYKKYYVPKIVAWLESL